ncbi:PLP-dependent aminotransferase family protein [Acidiphilium acidophilum]|uniref:aminotransferase-like domain-containing protein n=1 Tax=Acidiphilium acidophilum TaxID=76588 RepID=UPI002E8E70CC|nr:PLP-dependent aminotransferase family protein [Acidiphilium acidophilum]
MQHDHIQVLSLAALAQTRIHIHAIIIQSWWRSPGNSMTGEAPKVNEALWRALFRLAPRSEAPLQLQLRRILVAAILDGRLPPGSALPSSRDLAKILTISRNTVALAYRQLIDDDLIEARERIGYFTRTSDLAGSLAVNTLPSPQSGCPVWSERIIKRYSQQRNIRKPRNWHEYPYPFVYGQSDPTLFPLAEWRECSRAALAVLAVRDWSSDMIDGDDPLLIEQLQQRILPRRGIWANSNQIMITVGAQHALYLLAELLVGTGCLAGIEDPGYPDARNILEAHGAQLRTLSLPCGGLASESEFMELDMVYLTPSHQCPTSSTMEFTTREALLGIADRNDLIIIEDDYESELNFYGQATPALKSLDRSDRVIYIGSLSKTLAPGLRLGYIVAAPEVIFEARALRRLMLRHPPANNQRAAGLFLQLGYHDTLVRRLIGTFSSRAAILTEALNTHLSEFSFSPVNGGSSLWVKGPVTLDARRLANAAERVGVLIEPGDVFFHVPGAVCPYFRVGFSSIPAERIEPGIRRLASLIDGLI